MAGGLNGVERVRVVVRTWGSGWWVFCFRGFLRSAERGRTVVTSRKLLDASLNAIVQGLS